MSMETEPASAADADGLPMLAVTLLKGVVYQEDAPRLWNALLNLQARVRDYFAVLGLELVMDEAEGYAFLRSRRLPEDERAADAALPRLVARRPLAFPVSLLLALLRRKLAENDAGGGDPRLVLSRDEIVDLLRVFLPDSSNEARLVDRIDTHINKIVELGFLRRLKPAGRAAAATATYEVRRILKAFVDAQWLADFDARLAAYQAQSSAPGGADE